MATSGVTKARPRWVPQSAREAKDLADSAGRQLSMSLCSTGNARAWAMISVKLDAQLGRTADGVKISDELLRKLANEHTQLASAIQTLRAARTQFANAKMASVS
jgi:hypothetical protein